jgi:hypothetical protein
VDVTGARPDDGADAGREAVSDAAGVLLDGTGVVTGAGVAPCVTARPAPDTVTEQPAASNAPAAAVHPNRMQRS